mmetsp:Transcript_26186/g.55486  ORF Transcript_26186/g.55486 Transcript_26186/m.55486 type:complete len:211 (-) Transcript_26186:284-916(-)
MRQEPPTGMTQPWSSKSLVFVTISPASPETSNSSAYSWEGCQAKGGLPWSCGRSGPSFNTSGSTSLALCCNSCSCDTTDTSCCNSSRERSRSSSVSRCSACCRLISCSRSCTEFVTREMSCPSEEPAKSEDLFTGVGAAETSVQGAAVVAIDTPPAGVPSEARPRSAGVDAVMATGRSAPDWPPPPRLKGEAAGSGEVIRSQAPWPEHGP